MKVSNNSGTGRRPSAVKVCRRQTSDKAVKQEIQVWDLRGLYHLLLEAYALEKIIYFTSIIFSFNVIKYTYVVCGSLEYAQNRLQ